MSTLEVVARGTTVASRPTRHALGRDWKLGYALVVPVFLVIFGLIAYPLGYSVWLSLQDVKVGAPGTFVGLANYTRCCSTRTPVSTARSGTRPGSRCITSAAR